MDGKKKVLLLLSWAVLSLALYLLLFSFFDLYVLLGYVAAAGLLMIAFTVLNRGFSKVRLPDNAPSSEIKRHNTALVLILIAIPLMIIPMIDYILLRFDYTLLSVLYAISQGI